MDLTLYARLRPMLFHSTHRGNLACIQELRALHSARTFAGSSESVPRGADEVRQWNGHNVIIRDQRPLQFGHIALVGGWNKNDLLQALAERVFFWPGGAAGPIAPGQNLIRSYGNGIVLRMGFRDLLRSNPEVAPEFCRYNSGGPRTVAGRKSPRGPDTFQSAEAWAHRPSQVVEVCFRGAVRLPPGSEVCVDGIWSAL